MCALFFSLKRQNSLAKQLESIVFESIIDTGRPLHLAAAAHEINIVFLEAVDTVTTSLLGRSTRTVRGAQQCGDVFVVGGNGYNADTDTKTKITLFPDKLVVANRHTQRLRCVHGFLKAAAFEQHAEFIAAQTCQCIAPTYLGLEQRTQLAKQCITRAVAAGVVDDLELVEIQIKKRV